MKAEVQIVTAFSPSVRESFLIYSTLGTRAPRTAVHRSFSVKGVRYENITEKLFVIYSYKLDNKMDPGVSIVITVFLIVSIRCLKTPFMLSPVQ